MDERRAPHLPTEVPETADEDLRQQTEAGLKKRFGAFLDEGDEFAVELQHGPAAGYLRCAVGPNNRPHVFEFFCRDVTGPFAGGALAVLLDFAEGSFEQYFAEDKNAFFPLDYTGHPFEQHIVFAKSEVRDFAAEQMADDWLRKHGQA